MFESLSERFSDAFRKISGRGRITDENVRESMDEVRTALLEADVHVDVVNRFCEEVLQDARGREVTKSLKPGQEMVGIVHDRLVEVMGDKEQEETPIMVVEPPPTIVMMCGLQGSGKTTTCGKLAAYLKKRGRSVMLVAADLQRPAAVEQLRIVAEQVQQEAKGHAAVHFYAEPEKCAEYGRAVGVALGVCQRALAAARKQRVDVLILDTAGRLHINDELMSELQSINRSLNPQQIFLVVDAMMGQDAVTSAKAFHERLQIDGVILTKFDSDTRGGAALSVKHVSGAPIAFVGVGERFDALEPFHAERMAGRILGMGDVVSLVEKAQEEVSEEEAEKLAEKMASGRFTLNDFLKQLRMIRRMGPLKQLFGLLPGVGSMMKNIDIDPKQLDRLEGIVNSMTKREREDVSLLNKSRVKRIARGSGTSPSDVSKLSSQFQMMQKVTKQMAGLGLGGKMKAMKEMGDGAGDIGGGMPSFPGLGGMPGMGRGSTKTASRKSGFKQRKRKGR